MTAQKFELVFQKISLSLPLLEAFQGTEVRKLTIHKKERTVSIEIAANKMIPLQKQEELKGALLESLPGIQAVSLAVFYELTDKTPEALAAGYWGSIKTLVSQKSKICAGVIADAEWRVTEHKLQILVKHNMAYYLAQKGYPVTVFDRNPVPGGMLTLGIPSFRLEKDVLNAEIDILKEMGVEFRCGVEVGKDVTIQQLRGEGYKGFYLAIGAQKSAKLRIPGEELEGVLGGVDFLREVNLGNKPDIGRRCAVIGGGNVAMDVCRSAMRLGAEETYVFYRRSEAEMPADPEEVREAMEEGVKFRFLSAPVEIIGTDGRASAIKIERMELGEPDERGRRKPVGTGEFEIVEIDSVIGAVGQTVDWGTLDVGALKTTKKNTAEADSLTYQTAQPDIFVGGDCYTGPKFAIDAIAAGKEAAISLHRYVHPGQTLTAGRDRREYRALDKEHAMIGVGGFDREHRQTPGYNAAKAKTFADARVTFTEEQVRKECARCLGCGATKVDSYLCIGCGLCTTKCKFDAIHLKKVRDWHAAPFEAMPIKVAENLVKRTGGIVKKAVTK